MEIIFDNVVTIDKKINQVSFSIKDGLFTAVNGIDVNSLVDLLLLNKRPSSGSLVVSGIVIKRTNKIVNYDDVKKRIGVLINNDYFLYNDYIVKDIYLNFFDRYMIKNIDIDKHISDSLKLVGFGKSILKKKFSELSYTQSKLVLLSCILAINPSLIILEEFEKGLIYRDRENFKKLFIKLKNKFGKNFMFVNSSVDFIMGYVDNLIVMNRGKLVYIGDKNCFYDNKIYKYLEMPKIISFTKYVNMQGHDIIEYTDMKELLKELYRKIK